MIKIPLVSLVIIEFATLLYYNEVIHKSIGIILFLTGGLFLGEDVRKHTRNIYSYKYLFFRFFVINYRINAVIGIISCCITYSCYQFFRKITYNSFYSLKWNLQFPIIILIVCIACSEELFFRGYLQTRFSAVLNLWPRIFLVSLSIATYKIFIHLRNINVMVAIEAGGVEFIGSLWLCFLRDKRKSLLPVTVHHIMWDLLIYSSFFKMPYWLF